MTKQIKANYKGSALEMLTVNLGMVQHAKDHVAEISAEQTNYDQAYLTDLETQIEDIGFQYLGVDINKALRGSTQTVLSHIEIAQTQLVRLNLQIHNIFKKDPKILEEVLIQNGFTKYYDQAVKKNQVAMINILQALAQNIEPGYKSTLITRGIPAHRIKKRPCFPNREAGPFCCIES